MKAHRILLSMIAVLAASALVADDEEETEAEEPAAEEQSAEASSDGESAAAESSDAEASGDLDEALPAMPTNAAPPKVFTALPLCRRIEGRALVRKPGGEWTDAEEGKFYPFGTSYRAEKGGTLVVAFGTGATATIADGSEFGTRAQAVGEKTRTIVLTGGVIELKLPDNLPEGAFVAAAPGFLLKNPAGVSRLTYRDMGDGDEAVLRCVTGSMGVEGRHFDIPVMHAADEIRIRTSRDHLSTFLYGTRGDYVVNLDQGLFSRDELDDDGLLKTVVDKRTLEWHLSPATKVVINRSVPAIGERMSVHTMAFDAAGERKSECAFCEGRAELNSGELVVKPKKDSEELARRAAEAEETTEGAAEAEESSDEKDGGSEGESSESSDDEEE